MTAPFSMDTIEFLQTINKLERRFGELVSLETLRSVYEAYERDGTPIPWDHRLYVLARDIFACGSWTTNLCAAAMSFDSELGRECRSFLTGCGNAVRKYGITVWLYDLMNDANLALFASEPSSRMPSLIQNISQEQLAQRRAKRGRKRYGNRKQREKAMSEHSLQMHRLAAYTMLKWGERERRSFDIAHMLLLYPAIGMCMLREDGDVLRMGAAPDMRYRRVVDHLHDRRAQADVEYELKGSQWLRDYVMSCKRWPVVRGNPVNGEWVGGEFVVGKAAGGELAGDETACGKAAGGSDAPDVRIELCFCEGCATAPGRPELWLQSTPEGMRCDECAGGMGCVFAEDRCLMKDSGADLDGSCGGIDDGTERLLTGFEAAERRYRYDAARLVSAYCDLWNERTDDPELVLEMLERDRDMPREPLWRDMAYLRDLAFSLLGEQLASDLVNGFAKRDEAQFRRGVMRLQHCVDMVWAYGLALMPLVMYMGVGFFGDSSSEAVCRAAERADAEERYCVASPKDMRRLEQGIDSLIAHESKSLKGSSSMMDFNGRMHFGESMAAVVMSRFPDERLARACALALFCGDDTAYGDALNSVIPPSGDWPGGGGGGADMPDGDDEVLKRLDFEVDFADDLLLAQSTDL